jgi:hypothetical protein
MVDGQSAGLFHYTTAGYAGVGVTQADGVRRLVYRANLKAEPGANVTGASVWLRSAWGLDGVCRFSRSLNGRDFEAAGESHPMKWAAYRGERVGLFTYNPRRDAGHVDVDWFHYEYSGQSRR